MVNLVNRTSFQNTPDQPRSSRINSFLAWGDHNILIIITLSFALGISLGINGPILPTPALWMMLFGCCATACILYKKNISNHILLAVPAFFLIGYISILSQLAIPFSADHIYTILANKHHVTVIGTLDSMVEHYDKRSQFVLNVEEIQLLDTKEARQPAHGKIRLSTGAKIPKLIPGETLMIMAKAGRITNFKTPGIFDYKRYMAAKGIYVSGWIKNSKALVRIEDHTQTLFHRILAYPEQIRNSISWYIRNQIDNKTAGLYLALLTGSRAGVSSQIMEHFKACGTMHMLAISGLHIGLLGLMTGVILRWLFQRSEWLLLHTHVPSLTLLVTLPILAAYAFIAGMNTPVLRALVMALLVIFAVLSRRQHNLLHLIAGAALLVLAINPQALFTASFQLSFSAVTALALCMPLISQTFRIKNNTPVNRVYSSIKTGLAISIVASIGTLPIMFFHFHRFSTIGPVMNLLVEPVLCFWALPWGLAAIPCIFFAPDLAAELLHVGGWGISLAQYLTAIGASLPYASIWTITPEPIEIICYGALVIIWITLKKRDNSSKILLPAGLLLCIHFTWGLWFPQKPPQSLVSYLDIGQGASTLLQLPDGFRLLIDGGGARGSRLNAGERIIAPYLWEQRLWRLDAAVITHPHSDHFNGMDFILRHFHPQTLYINGDKRLEGNYAKIIILAEKLGIHVITASAGLQLARGNNFEVAVLGMDGLEQNPDAPVNERCLVIKYAYGQQAFLFPADISKRSEKILLRHNPNLHADVLLAAHHGSATSNSQTFIQAIQPSVIVVSAGTNTNNLYPAPYNLSFWQEHHIKTLITREAGTVTCFTGGNDMHCKSFSQQKLADIP